MAQAVEALLKRRDLDNMKILVWCCGSRGDFQPHAALACGLQRAGFRVRILSNPEHEPMARELQLDFFSSGANFKEFFLGSEATEAITRDSVPGYFQELSKWMAKHDSNIHEALYQCVQEFQPDLIISGGPFYELGTLWIPLFFGVPTIGTNIVPMHTCAFDKAPPGAPRLCCGLNWIYYKLGGQSFAKAARENQGPVLDRLSGRHVEEFLPTAQEINTLHWKPQMWGGAQLWLVLGNEELMKDPTDPPLFRYQGYPTLPVEAQTGTTFVDQESQAALETFLSGGDAPVYIGWGSLKVDQPKRMVLVAVRALKIAGCRGVISGGWAELRRDLLQGESDSADLLKYCDEKVLFIKEYPHEQLFPRCSVIVHHGGAGTRNTSQASGKPTIVTPLHFDQKVNGAIVTSSETGLCTKHLMSLSPQELADAIKKCLTNTAMQSKCEAVGRKLREEDGVKNCVETIRRFVTEQVNTGKYHEVMKAYSVRKMQKIRR